MVIWLEGNLVGDLPHRAASGIARHAGAWSTQPAGAGTDTKPGKASEPLALIDNTAQIAAEHLPRSLKMDCPRATTSSTTSGDTHGECQDRVRSHQRYRSGDRMVAEGGVSPTIEMCST